MPEAVAAGCELGRRRKRACGVTAGDLVFRRDRFRAVARHVELKHDGVVYEAVDRGGRRHLVAERIRSHWLKTRLLVTITERRS